MENINKQVGKRIRHLRESKGFSQDQLAACSGLHRSHMGQLERGESNVTLRTLWRIGSALGVPVLELVRGIKQ